MSPFALFVVTLVLALVGLIGATIGTIRSLTLKSAPSTSDPHVSRTIRRSIVAAIASAVLFVTATALFIYIWASCAGEC